MKPNPIRTFQKHGFGGKPRSRGFTLVELMVVVVIIIVLAAVTFMVSGATRRSAIKVTDLNNLRSLATAAMAAGSDNVGRFPNIHAASNAAPYYLRDRASLESFGIFKETCLLNDPKAEGGAPNYDFWFMFANQTPIHYCYFAKDAPSEVPGSNADPSLPRAVVNTAASSHTMTSSRIHPRHSPGVPQTMPGIPSSGPAFAVTIRVDRQDPGIPSRNRKDSRGGFEISCGPDVR